MRRGNARRMWAAHDAEKNRRRAKRDAERSGEDGRGTALPSVPARPLDATDDEHRTT